MREYLIQTFSLKPVIIPVVKPIKVRYKWTTACIGASVTTETRQQSAHKMADTIPKYFIQCLYDR